MQPHPEELLDQYLAGELSAVEAERVRAYFDAEPGRRATIAAVRAVLGGAAYGTPPTVDVARADLMGRIEAVGAEGAVPSRGRSVNIGRSGDSRRLGMRPAWLVAVASVLVIALVWAIGVGRREPNTVEQAYATRAGQQATVTLRDGSRVLLAPATRLRVAYDAHGTRVDVDGEALFTVRSRGDRVFTVHTSALSARVLGTTFDVRQYRGEARARIAVTEGRVAIAGLRSARGIPASITLAAGGVGAVTDSGEVTVAQDGSAADSLEWTSGHLVFTKSPAREIVAELGRVYGVKLRLQDSALAAQPISWSVSTQTMSLAAALDELGALLESHYVRTGDVITIIPGRHTSTRPVLQEFIPAKEAVYGR